MYQSQGREMGDAQQFSPHPLNASAGGSMPWHWELALKDYCWQFHPKNPGYVSQRGFWECGASTPGSWEISTKPCHHWVIWLPVTRDRGPAGCAWLGGATVGNELSFSSHKCNIDRGRVLQVIDTKEFPREAFDVAAPQRTQFSAPIHLPTNRSWWHY